MIRVVVADDQVLVRTGFKALLDAESDIEVVGEAGNGAEAVALALDRHPDVVLMDVRMPVVDGLTATRQIADHPQLADVRVLVLTTFELDEYVYEALRAGASGFLVKHTEPAELIRAVRVVAAGEALLSPGVTRRLISTFAERPVAAAEPDARVVALLTAREREAVALVADGLSNEEIAERWVVSNATVRTHVSRAMTKLNARDRAQLVVFAYRAGLAAIPQARILDLKGAAAQHPSYARSPHADDDATIDDVHPGRMTATATRPTPRPSLAETSHAVVVDRLTKRFGDRIAVDEVSFSIPSGSVAGLIGPNGAGKTTIMAMLLGLVRPSGGSATVLGSPVSKRTEYLPRVGALIEGPAFHPGVSGFDSLRSLAVLGGHSTVGIDDLIDIVGLTGRGGDRVGSYSFGMKQRLGIAAALIGDPQLVILDEPTNGLDPVGMQDVRTLIREISDGGRTVIVSSHLLGELEHVCDWLIVLDHGGVVHRGSPESLGGTTDTLVLRAHAPERLDDLAVIAGSSGLHVERSADRLSITIGEGVDAHRLAIQINRRAHDAGIILAELHYERADLEARYLELVNRHVIQGGMS